jgi:hypothetical protein
VGTKEKAEEFVARGGEIYERAWDQDHKSIIVRETDGQMAQLFGVRRLGAAFLFRKPKHFFFTSPKR